MSNEQTIGVDRFLSSFTIRHSRPLCEAKSTMNTQAGRVLVADADENAQAFCRYILEDLGFSIEMCENGAQAVEMLGHTHVDAILIDPGGPGSSEIGQRVRADRRFAETVVLLLDSAAPQCSGAVRVW